VLDTLVIVDMGHTTLTIHEHEAIVANELSDHGQIALVVNQGRRVMNCVTQVVLNEMVRIATRHILGVTCVQHTVVHHGNITWGHIVWVAVAKVCVTMRSPAEVNRQVTVVSRQLADESRSVSDILGKCLDNAQALGRAVHDTDAVRVRREDVAQHAVCVEQS
jgi:hypothetical protein